jgi:hypothetical protein
MSAQLGVSVVSPFFNEASIIRNAVCRMARNLDAQFGADWELILVDDGSTDDSRRIVTELLQTEEFPQVSLVGYDRNQGRGRALMSGIMAARADIIVTTEVDCSWGDDIVRRLVDAMEAPSKPHMVAASVHAPGGGLINVPLIRRLLTSYGNALIRLLVDPKISMSTGMTRAYRRQVIQPLIVNENGKEFHLEVILKLRTLGFRIDEIPATITWDSHRLENNTPGQARKSKTNLLKTINSHVIFVAIGHPSRYFGVASILSIAISSILLLDSIWRLLTGDVAIYVALIAILGYMFALTLAGFAVVFSQLKEVMRENWMRPYPHPWPPSALQGRLLATGKRPPVSE